jgi:purine-binding chemotaxis protein CheW
MNEVQTQPVNHDAWGGAEEVEVLTFALDGEVFALEAVLVQEIMDLTTETAVPGAPAFVGSVINFRGKVIPLADLRAAFGLAAAEATIDSRIVVIETAVGGEAVLVGLRTDKVHEVTALIRADSEAPPSVGMRWRPEFIRCLVKRGGEFIVVPDLQAIFSHQHDGRGATGAPSSSHH